MPAVGAIIVVVVGKWLAARAAAKEGRPGEAPATQASKT
jgi:hypothetical protein